MRSIRTIAIAAADAMQGMLKWKRMRWNKKKPHEPTSYYTNRCDIIPEST